MKHRIKRCMTQAVALLLAFVMLFTDCMTGFAAETAGTDITEESLLEEDRKFLERREKEPELSEAMLEDFSGQPAEQEQAPHVLFELEDMRVQDGKQYRLSDG